MTSDYYKRNAEKIKHRTRQWAVANPDKVRGYKRTSQLRNIDKVKSRNRKYKLEHADKVRAAGKKYYQEHKAERRAYITANSEKIAIQRKRWEKDHPGKMRGYRAKLDPAAVHKNKLQWKRRNPEIVAASKHKARAIKRAARIGTDRAAYVRFVRLVRSAPKMRCYWCERITPKRLRRIDHIVPLAKGGADDVHNLCCACDRCNSRKRDDQPEEFSRQFHLDFCASLPIARV